MCSGRATTSGSASPYLPPDFPVNTPGWQVVAQWKNAGEGSPPVEIKVGNGQFQLDGGAGGENPQENDFTSSIPAGPAGAPDQHRRPHRVQQSTN